MSEPNNTPSLLGEALLEKIRQAVRQQIQAANQNGHQGDWLLDVEETAKLLCVEEGCLYRHHKKLPFSKKLGPKMLRFSYQGIQKYLATRKNA